LDKFVIEKRKFNQQELLSVKSKYIDQYPIIYILYNDTKRPQVYIGQTVQVNNRMRNHLKNSKRKKLSDALLIGHKHFNQSATYNLETNLINHFIGDEKFKLQNISQTRKVQMHAYYQKPYYDEELFKELWDELYAHNIVDNSLDVIRNKDIYKLSPYTELSAQQLEIKEKIVDYTRDNIKKDKKKVFFIQGEAGSGKSVVVSSLFNTIQDLVKDKTSPLHKTNNYLLVNHGEMIKTYESMAESLPNLTKNRIIKPTSFVNQMDKTNEEADVVIIDEAHLLLTQSDPFNNFTYDDHLEEIIKRSKVTVVIFDPKQVLKLKSFWQKNALEKIKSEYNADVFELTDQFRMLSSYETNNWIDNFVAKSINELPSPDKEFDMKIMKSPDEMKKVISHHNRVHGLSRVVSTFDYEHKKDGGTYIVDSEGLNMPWNTTDSSYTWAERPETVQEVGSIYTVQGFDLNYVGVMIGPSIDYSFETNELVIDSSKYQDRGGFTGKGDMTDAEVLKAKEKIILNSLNVLLKRGVHGLYIYAVNDNLRKKLLELQKERDEKHGINEEN
jgi:hypothetical protein